MTLTLHSRTPVTTVLPSRSGCTINCGNDKEPDQSPNGHTLKRYSHGTQVLGFSNNEFNTLMTC